MPYSPCCNAFTNHEELGRCPLCQEGVNEDEWVEPEEDNWLTALADLDLQPKEIPNNID